MRKHWALPGQLPFWHFDAEGYGIFRVESTCGCVQGSLIFFIRRKGVDAADLEEEIEYVSPPFVACTTNSVV